MRYETTDAEIEVTDPFKLTQTWAQMLADLAVEHGAQLSEKDIVGLALHVAAHGSGRVISVEHLYGLHATAVEWFAECERADLDHRFADLAANFTVTAEDGPAPQLS
jgi:hypothetical protein